MRHVGRKRWERERDSKRSPNKRHGPKRTPRAAKSIGDETTRYRNDPLKGNPRNHAIVKMARGGMSPRKIAKTTGLSLDEVKAVIELKP